MSGPEAAGGGSRGLVDASPRVPAPLLAAGLGALWGVFGYTVLWDGTPFAVSRRFVVSVVGTVVLLPVRAVLWGIHRAELMAGHPFEFADDHWWIGVAAAAVGAAIVAVVSLAVRSVVTGPHTRRVRG